MWNGRTVHPSDLSEAEWSTIRGIVPAPKFGGRPAEYSRRKIVNALLYKEHTGCQWRELPEGFPPWKLVYWYFMQWRDNGLLDHIHQCLACAAPRTNGGVSDCLQPRSDEEPAPVALGQSELAPVGAAPIYEGNLT
jgi:transposase